MWKDTKAKQTFAIHEILLGLNGTLLSQASQAGTQEPPYKLSEFSIRSFQLYVDWLYHRELQVVKLPDEDEKDKFERPGEAFALDIAFRRWISRSLSLTRSFSSHSNRLTFQDCMS